MEKLIDVGKMDNYYEQIVKKKFSSTSFTTMIISLILIIVAMVLSVYLSTYVGILVPVAIVLFFGGAYLIYYMIKNSGIEYEYTFVRGEMRVEKIKGKTRRRKITTFDVSSIENIDKYIDSETGNKNIDSSKFNVVLKAAQTEISPETYYVIIHDKVRQKRALLLFTPNDITLNKIKPYLSMELKKKFFLLQKNHKSEKKETQDSDYDASDLELEKETPKKVSENKSVKKEKNPASKKSNKPKKKSK